MTEVYDIEVTKSCITYTGLNVSTLKYSQYVIHKDRDDTMELINHLKSLKYGIGFNNINFDYPVLHYLINITDKLIRNAKTRLLYDCVEEIIELVFIEAQRIIEEQSRVDFFSTVAIKEADCYFKQIDLFKIWHYNNPARRTSLKALQISMNLPNVMEMEVDYKREDITIDEVESILKYNKNDVEATYQFYLKSIQHGKMQLRSEIFKNNKLNCFNWNNGKIGEELILNLYCQKTGLNYWDVKKLRTYRSKINIKDCIPNIVNFTTNRFKEVKKAFENKVINVAEIKEEKTKTKGKNKIISIVYKECKIDYGLGGVHGLTHSGVYESNEKYVIKTCDVASLYPWLPIIFRFYPEHLGETFLEVYENNIVRVRLNEKLKPKELQNKAIVDGYKEAANIPYGKSNDENSFLYDPLYTMKTTVAGQLCVSMLFERLSEIPNCKLLMLNTDGCEVLIPREYNDLYNTICSQWEKETGLILEFGEYNKLWVADINNYGCIDTKGKIKNKGRFEVDKVVGGEPAYHKDNSFRIIPLAIQEYFINNTPIEKTIKEHSNIYDFCGREKFDSKSYGETNTLTYDTLGNPYNKIEKQQRNTRYYITTKGSTFIKRYNKGTSEFINKGYQVKIFNRYEEKEMRDYKIDYQFYINACRKEISNIISNQQTLNF